jgi:hypothetical protein
LPWASGLLKRPWTTLIRICWNRLKSSATNNPGLPSGNL